MQIIRWLGLVALLVLFGCQSQKIAALDDAELQKVPENELVGAWIDTSSPRVKAELERRGTFSEQEWDLIRRRGIQKGMREQVVYVSWGQPWRINEQVDAFGTSKQLCYDVDSYGIARTFVYVSNGRVTGWQEFNQ